MSVYFVKVHTHDRDQSFIWLMYGCDSNKEAKEQGLEKMKKDYPKLKVKSIESKIAPKRNNCLLCGK